MAYVQTLAEIEAWRDMLAIIEAVGRKDWEGFGAVWRNTPHREWIVASLSESLLFERGADAERMLANIRRGLDADQAELTA